MGSDASVPCSANQTFASLDRDVLVGLGVKVPLGQSKVDYVDNFGLLPASHHEVVGLDIAVHEALSVDHLQTGDDLDPDVEGSSQRETLLAGWQ